MAIFKYKAINQRQEKVAGLIEAPNNLIASEILKDRGLATTVLSEKKGGFEMLSFGGVGAKDLVVFARQFSVLVTASVSLVQSLKMLSGQTKNPKLKAILREVSEEIDGGARLSDTLAKRPKTFSGFFVNVVRSGESSGKLDEVLNYLADELEKDYDMTSKIKGAMIYPAFVMSGMSAVGVLMMVFVVPKLTGVIAETGMELPLATRILIAVSDFLKTGWWSLFIIFGGLALAYKMVRATPAGKKAFDALFLHTPVFGQLFQEIYLVRFARSLQTLLMGGVNLSQGLAIAADVVSSQIYKDLILETKKDVEDGNPIAGAFERSAYVPAMVSQMISIGEKTGKLDSILGSISHFYGREIDNKVSNLMTLMEPVIMVVMGIGVGIMVAAVIMPMYNMASAF